MRSSFKGNGISFFISGKSILLLEIIQIHGAAGVTKMVAAISATTFMYQFQPVNTVNKNAPISLKRAFLLN